MALVEELDKLLMVQLRDGRKVIGILRSFDQFANLVLQGAPRPPPPPPRPPPRRRRQRHPAHLAPRALPRPPAWAQARGSAS
jgi:hypothetical protein